MIEFKNVSCTMGEKKILDGVSLRIEDGETLCVYGPSGKGKTTVLRLIAGLEKPQGGTVTVTEKGVSAVFQEDRLLPWKNVMDNIMLFSSDREKAQRLLAESGLSGEEGRNVSILSGGMKRRVALIRALCHPHELLLLDEPFSGMDDKTAEICAAIIKKETRSSTVVICVHSPETARRIDPSCRLLKVGD